MALIITATFGLCLWIVLWALNVSGLDGLLLAILFVLIVTLVRTAVPQRRDR
jgi:hypothetical protein